MVNIVDLIKEYIKTNETLMEQANKRSSNVVNAGYDHSDPLRNDWEVSSLCDEREMTVRKDVIRTLREIIAKASNQ